MKQFDQLGLSSEMVATIARLGFTKPMSIQEQSIPAILAGHDVVAESATGSGKTLAFGSAIIDKVVPRQGLQALILTPTRELAQQVHKDLVTFSGHKRLHMAVVYGGVAMNPQIQSVRHADVVIATPGRLLDHLQRQTVNLSQVRILVLDEADRMLDMGFIRDVERIMKGCPQNKQTLFFSATLAREIKELARRYMKSPVEVSAPTHVDPSKLKQVYYDVPHKMKLDMLLHLLEQERTGLVLVFCNTRRTTNIVARTLHDFGVDAVPIHGGLSQNKRTKTLDMFHHAHATVLVCTDVAGRGLHIKNVSHVYNYEIPKDAKDYVHRIGRTARAGESGLVVNLLSKEDYGNFSRVQREYRTFVIEKIKTPEIDVRPRPEPERYPRQQQHHQRTERPRWSHHRQGRRR